MFHAVLREKDVEAQHPLNALGMVRFVPSTSVGRVHNALTAAHVGAAPVGTSFAPFDMDFVLDARSIPGRPRHGRESA